VVIDRLEMLYLAGFPVLHLLVTTLPLLSSNATVEAVPADMSDHLDNVTMTTSAVAVNSNSMEFLPLLLTSVYCAVGLVWAYVRIGAIYVADMVQVA
jgi:alpha-1,3-glucosyltransferase